MERKTAFSEKTGLKRGSWSLEEDMKLTAYIKRYGHWNWRELPKFAGLSRCGKSCRLRWMNYLRPDIKRGNFTKEEEEIIINLHESFGNRWSAIAAKLPGRTDNEIKNHWHTHLKKSFKKNRTVSKKAKVNSIKVSECKADKERESESNMYLNCATHPNSESSSSLSSKDSITFCNGKVTDSNSNLMETLEEFDTSFWTEPFIVGDSFTQENFIENLYPFGFYSDDCTDYFSNQLIPVELFDLY